MSKLKDFRCPKCGQDLGAAPDGALIRCEKCGCWTSADAEEIKDVEAYCRRRKAGKGGKKEAHENVGG